MNASETFPLASSSRSSRFPDANRTRVVLLTHEEDHDVVERVAAAVDRRGLCAVRLDAHRFPAHASAAVRTDCASTELEWRDGETVVRASEVRSVWSRHLGRPGFAADLDPSFRDAAVRESTAALDGIHDAFHRARWLNAPAAVRRAQNKLFQLRLARDSGLEIPRTLLTNDPVAVRDFFDALAGRVVAKMLTPLTTSMDGSGPFVYTSRLRAADLERLDGLRHAPMLFQEEVPKARELRVMVVTDRCFTGAIDASRTSPDVVDWRRADPAEVAWQPDTLPAAEAQALRATVRSLGIELGAADIIRTPDGRHVFLEINPSGEWGMLERDLGLPISEAIAEELCR